jgi:restriction system protein
MIHSEQVIKTKPVPTCPECGAMMILRRPKPDDDWSPFWGCMDYPDCRGTRDILPDGRPAEDDDWLEEL